MAKSSRPGPPVRGSSTLPDIVRVKFRIGDTRAGGRQSDVQGGLLNEPQVQAFQKTMLDVIKVRASGRIQAAFRRSLDKIEDDIRQDLDDFAQIALRFATSQESPERGTLKIAPPPVARTSGTATFKSFIRTSNADLKIAALDWPSLTKRWMDQKKNRTFFVGKGAALGRRGGLKGFLGRELGSAYQELFDPRIVLRTENERTDKGTVRERVARITVSFSQKNPALAREIQGLGKTGVDDSGILEAMFAGRDDVIRKLENRGRGRRPKRPWVGAFARFWLVNRMPEVANSSLSQNIARLKRSEF